jgi:hypothetical protein
MPWLRGGPFDGRWVGDAYKRDKRIVLPFNPNPESAFPWPPEYSDTVLFENAVYVIGRNGDFHFVPSR